MSSRGCGKRVRLRASFAALMENSRDEKEEGAEEPDQWGKGEAARSLDDVTHLDNQKHPPSRWGRDPRCRGSRRYYIWKPK